LAKPGSLEALRRTASTISNYLEAQCLQQKMEILRLLKDMEWERGKDLIRGRMNDIIVSPCFYPSLSRKFLHVYTSVIILIGASSNHDVSFEIRRAVR
jgi:hypothetical protein